MSPKAETKKGGVGQGKKKCPECGKVIAAVKKTCDCGHQFMPKGASVRIPVPPNVSLAKKFCDSVGGPEAAKKAIAQWEGIQALMEGKFED